LPQENVPLALLLFNVGVEIGQLLFIAAALLAIRLVRRIASAPHLARAGFVKADPARPRLALVYAIGGFAAYWFFDRLITGFSGASLA
jgi:hypothetical protein